MEWEKVVRRENKKLEKGQSMQFIITLKSPFKFTWCSYMASAKHQVCNGLDSRAIESTVVSYSCLMASKSEWFSRGIGVLKENLLHTMYIALNAENLDQKEKKD